MEGALAPWISLGDGIGHGLREKTVSLFNVASVFPVPSTECVVSNTCYFCLEGLGFLVELVF